MWQAWKEKGQGLLTVRQPASADGGARAGPSQIVFTTESGRVLVNAALYRGVKVVPQARFPSTALVPVPPRWRPCLPLHTPLQWIFAKAGLFCGVAGQGLGVCIHCCNLPANSQDLFL